MISLCGALVYAELASRHPETGGEYTFLMRGLGRGAAFLFAWSRMTVIQTGAIVAVAFAFGDYASEIVRLGENSSAIWAAIGVVALTALNLAGTAQSKTLQKVMEIVLIGGAGAARDRRAVRRRHAQAGAGDAAGAGLRPGHDLRAVHLRRLERGGLPRGRSARRPAQHAEDPGRSASSRVTALYLLVNIGYLLALGLGGMRESKAVAADVMRAVAGEKGAVLLALVVCVSALTTMNAAVFTGARTNCALGRDFGLFGFLGSWRESG